MIRCRSGKSRDGMALQRAVHSLTVGRANPVCAENSIRVAELRFFARSRTLVPNLLTVPTVAAVRARDVASLAVVPFALSLPAARLSQGGGCRRLSVLSERLFATFACGMLTAQRCALRCLGHHPRSQR
jgi:hypothetical protein